jgi:hypothetical protein
MMRGGSQSMNFSILPFYNNISNFERTEDVAVTIDKCLDVVGCTTTTTTTMDDDDDKAADEGCLVKMLIKGA